MSIQLEMTEARLRLGLIKLALTLVGLLAIIVVGLSLLAGTGTSYAITLLLVCVSFSLLTNGAFAVLKIVDWFAARKAKANG